MSNERGRDTGMTRLRAWAVSFSLCCVYYACVVTVAVWGTGTVGAAVGADPAAVSGLGVWPRVRNGLAAYVAVMVSSRAVVKGPVVFYEFMWGCNVALVLAAVASHTGSALLLGASVVSVCVDQVMWYVDVAAYLAGAGFPVGVAKYIVWPSTGWTQLATSGHHLGFIPLVLWMLRSAGTGFVSGSFALSVLLLVVEGVAARLFAPYAYDGVVLNINLSHECWSDVPFPLLHIADGASFIPAMAWLVTVWSSTNAVCYAVLLLVSHV